MQTLASLKDVTVTWLCSMQVVEQNGQWYCEYDGKTYPSMVRRYVTTLRCTDNTAELTLNAFNEQVSGPLLSRLVCSAAVLHDAHLMMTRTHKKGKCNTPMQHVFTVAGLPTLQLNINLTAHRSHY